MAEQKDYITYVHEVYDYFITMSVILFTIFFPYLLSLQRVLHTFSRIKLHLFIFLVSK